MKFVKHIGGAAALGVATLIGAGLCAPPAQAAYIVTLAQVGTNVVATGSGTIDLAGLTLAGGGSAAGRMFPSGGAIVTGPASFEPVAIYTGFIGPSSFGSGGPAHADSGSGDRVGIISSANELSVPAGYVSGNPLSDISTYDGQTFASLGVTPGVYVWRWGVEEASLDDSFTLDATVPEPSSLLLLALPLGLVMLLAARPRRGALPPA